MFVELLFTLLGISLATVDPAFSQYMDSFYALHPEAETGISVNFEEPIPNAVGDCFYSQAAIRIKPSTWQNFNERQREWLIHHELGHCALKLDHSDIYPMQPIMPDYLGQSKNEN